MSMAKILKAKSFDKRMELVLQIIREADEKTKEEAIDSLFEVCKYPAHQLSALAVAIKFQHSKLDDIFTSVKSSVDNPSQIGELIGLFVVSGKVEEALQLFNENDSRLPFARKLHVAWCLLRFAKNIDAANVIIQNVETMKIDDSMTSLRNEYLAMIKDKQPKPPTNSADLRFFLDDSETSYDFFGGNK
jgi:hypothetical protein